MVVRLLMFCLECRYGAAMEMLGERDEKLEELRADLQDVKEMYKQQLDFLTDQLVQKEQATESRTGRAAAA